MKLLINPGGGMSGDMFSAALISAGASFDRMKETMTAAGEKLGSVDIGVQQVDDGSTRLLIHLESNRHHLGSNEGKNILEGLFERYGIQDKYRVFGMKTLDILVKAEKRAHREFNIHIEPEHDHEHHHHEHHHHEHHESHIPEHHHENHLHDVEESFLHEAQDIVIDIMGAVTGLQELGTEPEAGLICPVSVGGGHVHCSHGTLLIPAPATTIILEEYRIPWQKGPIEKELFTPTGAAILAALGSRLHPGSNGINVGVDIGAFKVNVNVNASGKSRGTKTLDIPPLEVILYS